MRLQTKVFACAERRSFLSSTAQAVRPTTSGGSAKRAGKIRKKGAKIAVRAELKIAEMISSPEPPLANIWEKATIRALNKL